MGDVVQCAKCGTELDRPGQGHTCRSLAPEPIAPPTGWVVTTWVVLAFAALYIGGALWLMKLEFDLADSGSRTYNSMILVASVAWLLIFAGTVISQVVWNRRTRRVAERYGFDGKLVVQGWFVRAYAATVLVAVCASPALGLDEKSGIAFIAGIRVVIGLALITNILVGRARLLRLIADSARLVEQARAQRSGSA